MALGAVAKVGLLEPRTQLLSHYVFAFALSSLVLRPGLRAFATELMLALLAHT